MTLLAKNIRYLRLKNHMTQDELAEKLNKKSYTTIQKWESGVSEPTLKTVAMIAEIFKVSLNNLASKDLEREENDILWGICYRVPVLGDVPGENPMEMAEKAKEWEEIPEKMAKEAVYYCLRVCDNSMTPNFSPNDIVIVQKSFKAEDGDIVIVRLNRKWIICRRLKNSPSGLILLAANPAIDPLFFSTDTADSVMEIIGKVIEVRIRF